MDEAADPWGELN